ncbi:MAG: hypothetical protein QOC96_2333 [Acidobacteriota bacterium]|jgi:hypothetical protein|nr:hypothetical protein [Acidobacteriota bacterium]
MSTRLKLSKLLLFAAISTIFSIGLAWTSSSEARRNVGAPASPNQEEKGTIIAEIKFDPKVDGFGFKNYGRDHEGEGDLDAADMVRMFGAQNVCIEGKSADDCVLYETAQAWIDERIEAMKAGHCEGFAVDSLRFWMGKGYRGKTKPGDFQSDAEKTFDLKLDEPMANYIAYYFSLQGLKEVYEFRGQTLNMKPSQILDMLVESFKDGKEYYTMSIAKRINGEYKYGHAITPFGVEDMGGGDYRILVYDNNYVGQTRWVEINKNEETWRYHTASNPNETESDYVGDTSTHTLGLKRMSDRERTVYECPFCEEESGDHASPASAELLTFELNGEGNILITDGAGRRLGFDPQKNQTLSEIPGAQALVFEGGLGLDVPPTYKIPYQKGGKPFTINVSGKSLKSEVDADMEIDGPGFVVGFDNIALDPGENLTMTVSPDGQQLSFTASQDGQTPDIFITTESGPQKPSYEFKIGGIKLSPGKTVTVTLDLKKERLYFKDDDAKRDKYDVKVERTNADGTKNYYEHKDLEVGKRDNYEIDFSKWNGKGPLCVVDDEEGNGFEDDKCVEEPNEAKPPVKKKSYYRNAEPDIFTQLVASLLF